MCGESGRFIHVGFNTQDIHDLAVSLQIKEGMDLIEIQVNELREVLIGLAKKHRNTIMVGRELLLPSTLPNA